MPDVKIRKMVESLEETWHEGGARAEKTLSPGMGHGGDREPVCRAV